MYTYFFQLAGDYDVVVNCAGYGNKALLGDTKLFPNRGHVIRVGVTCWKPIVAMMPTSSSGVIIF